MDFYTALSEYYDEIFPLEKQVVDFVAKRLVSSSGRAQILDVGCATGSLAIALAKKGHSVAGMDLDPVMIDSALSRSSGIPFKMADMMNIELVFHGTTFSHILCFGNTLVHLPSQENIERFLSRAFTLLDENGKFLFQILNYDHILSTLTMILPTIETKTLSFSREYRERDDGRLDFNTILTIKETNTIFSSSVPLLPLRKDDIDTLLQMAGFSDIRFFSGFAGEKYNENSFVLVCEAVK